MNRRMKFVLLLLGLPLAAFSAALTPPTDSVCRTLQTRIDANTLSQFDPAQPIDSLARSLRADGTWPDLDYAAHDRSRWQAYKHWERILLLSQAYRTAGHPAYNRPELKAGIGAAVAYWTRTKPVHPIYWWNAIGVPVKMGESLLLLGDDLPADQRVSVLALMKLGVKPDYYEYHGTATGQNQVWLASIHLMTGVLECDTLVLRRAFTALHDEIKVTTEEGIQPDWSFHQHGTTLYAGGYGLGFTRDQARLIQLAQGTLYQFPAEKVAIFSGYVLDGQQWMIRGTTFDHSAVGREIARPAFSGSLLKGLPTVGLQLADLDGPRKAEFRTMAARMAGANVAPLTGNRHFWRSDLMTHHRPAYFSSVKTTSNRTTGSESGNNENLKGYYLGHGVHLLYRRGDEYRNIFPVWEWRRLPGHLAEQSPEPLPLFDWGKGSEGSTAFVGGVSDGTYGLTAYDYRRGNVRAKRAWFHFDGEIVCLGAGLTCPTDHPLFQSLNQCHLRGAVFTADPAGKSRILPTGEHTLRQTRWILHDSVGYVFPERPTVRVKNDIQSGSWRDINNSAAYTKDVLHLPVFSAWLDFGPRVTNGSYHYQIRPGVSATYLETARNPVVVLRNDTTLQAVRHADLRLVQAAFYRAGTLDAGDGLRLAVNQPVLLLARTRADGLDLSVSNPTNTALNATVTVNQKLACETCEWSATRRETTVSFVLPEGAEAGRSVSKRLTKR